MAYLLQPKSEEEVKKMTISTLKKSYLALTEIYKKILDGDLVRCDCCGEFLARSNFYTTDDNVIGVYPTCKKCILQKVEQRNKKNDTPNETKESVMKQLQKMDLPYIDSLYESCCKSIQNEVNEKNRSSPFLQMITILRSLPQYKGLKWKDSELSEDSVDNNYTYSKREPRKEIRKIFGSGFSNEDYLYLQDQYDDWRSRTQVDSKSQETYIVRICFKLLDIWKAQKQGKDTTSLDKSLNDLMNAANLQPKQNVANAATDSLTFGQLIEKWELEDPIPTPSKEFIDCDNIIRYIDIFFKGHLAKMMGLKNGYSHQYDDYMKQYTVTKPEYDEEEGSEAIFDALFGKEVE